MKKIIFLVIVSAFILNISAQAPSRCKPGDSTANNCTGFGLQVDLTYNFVKLKSTEMTSFQVSLMPGYHFCDYMFGGLGVGYANYNGFNFVPLFAHGTINFSKGKVIPFIQGKAGLMIGKRSGTIDYNLINYTGENTTPWYLSEVKGVYFIQPVVGVKFRIKNNQKLLLALTLDGMMTKITPVADPANPLHTKNGTMGLKIGYEF